MARGMFITVEGVEGVGKSTNMEFIASRLEAAGFDVLRSREPGGTPMAERIREMLLAHGDEPLPDLAELLLFFASRTLNIENAIRPALAAGTWVLCPGTDGGRRSGGLHRFPEQRAPRLLERYASHRCRRRQRAGHHRRERRAGRRDAKNRRLQVLRQRYLLLLGE